MYKKIYILQGWLWCLVCLLSFASWFADQPVQAKADKNKLQTPNEIIITAAVYADATCKGSPIATNESPVRQGTQVFFCYFLTNSGPYTFSIGTGYAVSDLLGVLWESNEFKVNTSLVLYRPMIAELPQTTQIVTFRGLEKAGDIFVMRTISQTIVANVTSVAVATFTPVSTIQPTSTPITPSPTSPSTQATPTPASTSNPNPANSKSTTYLSLIHNYIDSREPNNVISQAQPIVINELVKASLKAYDDEKDYYKIDLRTDRSYKITLTFVGNADLDLYVYDDIRERKDIDDIKKSINTENKPEEALFKPRKAGIHYILVTGYSTNGSQDYELLAIEQ